MIAALTATARARPDATALAWEDGALTYQALYARAGAFARSLAARGLRPGARLAVAIGNRWQFAAAVLGGLAAGLTVAPLDPLLKDDERAAILADLGPSLLVEDVPADAGDWLPRDPAGPALVLYTSGSTGRPKGVVIAHAALATANSSWVEDVMSLTPRDVVLAALPLSHSYGLNGALLAPLLAGATVVVVERFAPGTVARALAERGVTVFPGVATMFRRLLDSGFAGAPGLRIALSGAAPCPWPLAEEWRRRTGVRILRGYGSTELFRPISYLARDTADVPDAIGRPVPGVEVRVVDDDGQALPPGGIGELLIRTPAAMDGYLGAEAETRAVLRDGWFRTGDLATLSPDGYVRIAGRRRERILRGGYSIFPAEVEAALLTHPAVAEAAVIGVQHDELGEEIAAFVAVKPGATAAAEELIEHCRARLAPFKYPRRVSFVAALPRSATGKVQKARLRADG